MSGYLHPGGSRQSLAASQLLPAPLQELWSPREVRLVSAAVQAAGALLPEPARDAGMPGFGYFGLWHVLTLIQLACT